jgi:predicted nucleic acid-binding protein
LNENDLWIAVTGLALGATLVSRGSDFGDIDGLRVIALG